MKRYTVTARKEGKCSKCGQAILKGEQYMYYMASGRPGYYNDASKIS